jgi:predicted double-glycine peptidase
MAMRFKNVMHQTRDLSCGAAALGTILRYYYGEDVSEEQIIDEGFKAGDADKIRRDGFSMLELKRIAEKRGYQAGGFRIPDVEKLANLKVPVITLMSVRGYNHFVVVKGISDGRVYIADPAFGNRSRTIESFAADWDHVILVAVSPNRSPTEGGLPLGTGAKAPAPGVAIPFIQQQLTTPAVQTNRF